MISARVCRPSTTAKAAAPARLEAAREPARCKARIAHVTCHSRVPASADVLLVDAQNVLSRAHADHRRGGRLPGDGGVAGAFADWLQFLAAVAEPQLLVAVFDSVGSKRQQQMPQREQLAPEYLQRRKRRRQQPAGSPGGAAAQPPQRPSAGNPLVPYKQQVSLMGGISLEAVAGWEADDGLAAASQAVLQRHPWARILVASGDQDMQQLLTPQVTWLQLHGQASLECPLGAELVTSAAFQQRFGFPPAAYPDWLALTGKREASIQGADVGAKTAAKLLARYGSLEAVLAAAAGGQLKGWGPAVQQLLEGKSGSSSSGGGSGSGSSGSSNGSSGGGSGWEARLRRNRQLFACNPDPGVVHSRGMQQLLAAVDSLDPAGSALAAQSGELGSGGQQGGSISSGSSVSSSVGTPLPSSCGSLDITPQLAWAHPLHARRRRHLERLAAHASSSSGGQQGLQLAVTPQGLPVDVLVAAKDGHAAGSSGSSGGGRGSAIFFVCPCDVQPGSWTNVERLAAEARGHSQAQQQEERDFTKALTPVLHGAMRHHVKLVQRAGYRVTLQLLSSKQ